MSAASSSTKQRSWISTRDCAICGSKAIGINFGAPTCAPCKAFFRRNARRKEVLKLSCQIVTSDTFASSSSDESKKNTAICTQIRHCTSCRLRRCFDVGMKEELVRTDEEKQRYKQLIESNRQRKQELLRLKQIKYSKISQSIVESGGLLEEHDWTLLSNISHAYDNYCLKIFLDNRIYALKNEIDSSNYILSKVNHHKLGRVNNVTSLLSFLFAIPTARELSYSDRLYLCKHNIRPLILANLHELEQTCFTEPWQLNADHLAAEYVYGKTLFEESVQLKNRALSKLITDSAAIRLWIVILFFSNPLSCYFDISLPEISHENRLNIYKIQQSFIILLWKYLFHRHGYLNAVRIFSNLMGIYLNMQRVTQAINHQVRTRNDLVLLNEGLDRATTIENEVS